MIVGLGHKSRRGKDTLAQMLTQLLPGRVGRGSFAAPLKDAAHRIWGFAGLQPGDFYELRPERRADQIVGGKDVVQLWIELGQKVREIYPETWLDLGLAHADRYDFYVVSDVRFPNEADAIRNRGGVVIRVDNPRVTSERDSDRFLNDYPSWDYVVNNQGTLDDLRQEAQVLASILRSIPQEASR